MGNLIDANTPKDLKFITLGMKSFYIPDSQFGIVPGIYKSHVGYSGGNQSNPTYQDLKDHTQSIQLYYSPLEISFKEILAMFFESTIENDKIIFYNNEEEKQISESELTFKNLNHVKVKAFESFKIAEEIHQKYYIQKDTKLYSFFLDLFNRNFWDFVNSTASLKFNAYAAGNGNEEMILEDCNKLNLPENLRGYIFKS